MHPRPLTQIEIAEAQALASPRDYPGDFDKPTCWNVCGDCLHMFIAIPCRIICRACKELKCSPS